MKEIKRELSSIQVRQIKVMDGDKVRYRVYRNKEEYVAVIAENALAAIKVSEIKEPYRIVRDLPTHEIAISANRLGRQPEEPQKISLPTELKPLKSGSARIEMTKKEPTVENTFQAMGLGDLKNLKRQQVIAQSAAEAPPPAEEIAFLEPPKAKIIAAERAAAKAVEAVPPPAEPTPEPAPGNAAPGEDTPLSPEQVDRLLNG